MLVIIEGLDVAMVVIRDKLYELYDVTILGRVVVATEDISELQLTRQDSGCVLNCLSALRSYRFRQSSTSGCSLGLVLGLRRP